MKHTNTVKEGNAFTGGEWEIRDFKEDGLTIWGANNGNTCICTINEMMYNSQFPSIKSEAEANARLIAESKNLFKIVGELIQYLEWREDFLIEDSEEGETNVYTQAKAIINRINNQ